MTLCQWVFGSRRFETMNWLSNVGYQILRTYQKNWYLNLLKLGWFQASPAICMRSAFFWNIMQRRVPDPWTLNMMWLGCPETSVRNYHSILHNILDRVQISCKFFEVFIRWEKFGIYIGIMVRSSLFTAWVHTRVELYTAIILNRSTGWAHLTTRPPYPAKGTRIPLE